ncbi:hypothetical protein FNU79_07125 [Deinococcus detaillensis]|uniref:Uncharacterized protein n=1 Tax=Deinococcus detaillensis TaxID=2592048 RepID=A0A553V1P5_9DEIO|nr:hypothetical protein [Deinococcus detaillensis]TSA86419.1 hypothetical protein FNU79_07125 [Deinococcus detaillensis]
MKQFGFLLAGTLLLAGCDTVTLPNPTSSEIESAPSSITLNGATITVTAEIVNSGNNKKSPTFAIINLASDLPIPSNVVAHSFYVLAGDKVYRSAPISKEVFLNGNRRYTAELNIRLDDGTVVRFAALMTDGKTTRLVQLSQPIKVKTVFVS